MFACTLEIFENVILNANIFNKLLTIIRECDSVTVANMEPMMFWNWLARQTMNEKRCYGKMAISCVRGREWANHINSVIPTNVIVFRSASDIPVCVWKSTWHLSSDERVNTLSVCMSVWRHNFAIKMEFVLIKRKIFCKINILTENTLILVIPFRWFVVCVQCNAWIDQIHMQNARRLIFFRQHHLLHTLFGMGKEEVEEEKVMASTSTCQIRRNKKWTRS